MLRAIVYSWAIIVCLGKLPAQEEILPTHTDVPYGNHERQKLDVYLASSDNPTPVILYIHGGGWTAGDKQSVRPLLSCSKRGISVVAINYRYTWQAQLEGVVPPVKYPMHDAARALQFIRAHAVEWNLDPHRIAATGSSAGGCTALWLAFHDDLADPTSADPIARMSTRLWCVAADRAQTSLDPQQLRNWTPNSRYGGHAFGFMNPHDIKTRDTRFTDFLQARESLLPMIREYSPISHVSSDDPSVYLWYNTVPAMGQPQNDPTHTCNLGLGLQQACERAGVSCELVYPGAPVIHHPSLQDFLMATLTQP